MPATANVAKASVQARTTEALSILTARLGLTDSKLLVAALAEVMAEEVDHNSELAARINKIYAELEGAKAIKTSSQPKVTKGKLMPISNGMTGKIDPYAPLDAHALLRMFGPEQLPQALDEYSRDSLKAGAESLQAQRPGTKPKSKSSKTALIEYIVQQVTDGTN